jgi:hypothetical protein
MRLRIAFGAVMLLALSAVVAGLGGATGIASAAPGNNYICSGGNWTGDPSTSTFISIKGGDYASITVTGVCNVVPGAVINVTGNINVAPGGVFDAQSAASTITVGHNVTAGAGSLLGLGCLPNPAGHTTGHPCADPSGGEASTITVSQNVTATGADTVLLNGITVNGNVTLTGGGGEIPWAIKYNTIGGNLTASGMSPDWIGVMFNSIGRNATLTNITITDPDPTDPSPTIFVISNTIGQNLNCMGLGPNLVAGYPPDHLNIVGHEATGQCALS